MIKIAFFDTKPYDKIWFNQFKPDNFKYKFFEHHLSSDSTRLAAGYDVVVPFVNDVIDKETINTLHNEGVKLIALRCAGYNNVDFKSAFGKINVANVPSYSPYAVAEHTMALLLTLNRKIHKAYNRTRDFNFSINGLTGFDLHGKTAGIIGTGKIGRLFINICKGFGMNVVAFDPYPQDNGINYVTLDELFERSDIISLHCPLTKETKHIINKQSIDKMKPNVYIINTSRGALIESEALLTALKEQKLGGACLDVYEEESDIFFEDFSNTIIQDDVLSMLVNLPNVIVTSHQAFLTNEALENIAKTTIKNIKDFFDSKPLENEICYDCEKKGVVKNCNKKQNGRCF